VCNKSGKKKNCQALRQLFCGPTELTVGALA
jgi:hypothetical protein